MKIKALLVVLSAFMSGAILGIMLSRHSGEWLPVANAQDTPKTPAPDLKTIQAEVERLKKISPDQAHAMQDVDYHFTNLWFAAKQENWPLAQFYLNETRSHLHWAVRIIPVRKDSAGNQIKLEDILQAVENGPLKEMEEAIKQKDRGKTVTAYEVTLSGCYACHKASEKAYLRPRIPEYPATMIINFDPNATTPK